MFKNKNVLVIGGTGLVGYPLVQQFLDLGANVRTASLDKARRHDRPVEHFTIDLRDFNNAMKICEKQDIIVHAAGLKGSPKLAISRPASFMTPMIMFNTAILEAIFRVQPEWAVYVSSVGVYAPADVFKEDTVWHTMPSQNDRFAGWAKRIGELQVEAYKIEHGFNRISVIRPTNLYGPFDNFDLETCMVVPATIRKILEADKEITVWGDGSSVRDFTYAKDVSEQIVWMIQNKIEGPLNGGCGIPISIKELVDTVMNVVNKPITVNWDTSKPNGDKYRVMSMEKATALGWKPRHTLIQGIKETIDWYLNAPPDHKVRFDALKA